MVIHEQSMNVISPLDESRSEQDTFQPIPGLVGYTRMTGDGNYQLAMQSLTALFINQAYTRPMISLSHLTAETDFLPLPLRRW